MRVLLVEDHPASRKALALALRQHGYAVDDVESATEASGLLSVHRYDALLVDIGLPEGPRAGLHFVRQLRADRVGTPVLFLTARDALEDRVQGLEIGGDDYLIKPCHPREVDARLKALARRVQPAREHRLRRGALEIDWESRRVSLEGREVRLTLKEYAVLELLAAHPGRYFSRGEIIGRVWDEHFASDDVLVSSYVKVLRRKLGPDVIQTVRGRGYRFPAA